MRRTPSGATFAVSFDNKRNEQGLRLGIVKKFFTVLFLNGGTPQKFQKTLDKGILL